jgi:hypothetical protein
MHDGMQVGQEQESTEHLKQEFMQLQEHWQKI